MRSWHVLALMLLLACALPPAACIPEHQDPDFTKDPDGKDPNGTGGGGGVDPGDDDDDDAGDDDDDDDSTGDDTLSPADPRVVQIVAGTGTEGYNGDSIDATRARLSIPAGLTLAPDGTLFIADMRNHRVRRVDPRGLITTVAGTGNDGFTGDNIVATLSNLTDPSDVAVDSLGDLYIADAGNHRIRKVTRSSGLISTVAGTGQSGNSGEGDPAVFARLCFPRGLALDRDDNLFIADTVNHQIRRVDFSTQEIRTVAGSGSAGSSGDGDAATRARLTSPTDVAVDAGSIFIADTGNGKVRRVDLETGDIFTFAGGGDLDPDDGGPAIEVRMREPTGLALTQDWLFVTDLADARVVAIDRFSGLLETFVGTGTAGTTRDDAPIDEARVDSPWGAAVSRDGIPYFSDAGQNLVFRLVIP